MTVVKIALCNYFLVFLMLPLKNLKVWKISALEKMLERETRVEKRNELEMCSSTLKDDIFSCSISCNNT